MQNKSNIWKQDFDQNNINEKEQKSALQVLQQSSTFEQNSKEEKHEKRMKSSFSISDMKITP